MGKAKIYATGNRTSKGKVNVSHYNLEKKQDFFEWFDKAVLMMGFKHRVSSVSDHDPDDESIYEKDVMKMVDVNEHYEDQGIMLDVFYGKKRIFIVLCASEEIRRDFAKFVEKVYEPIAIPQGRKFDRPWFVKKKAK